MRRFGKWFLIALGSLVVKTELRVAWRRSMEDSLASRPNEIAPYKILPPVLGSVKQVVSSRLKLFNAQLTPEEMHSSTR